MEEWGWHCGLSDIWSLGPTSCSFRNVTRRTWMGLGHNMVLDTCTYPTDHVGQVDDFSGPSETKLGVSRKWANSNKILWNGITLQKWSEKHQFGAEFLDKRNWLSVSGRRTSVSWWRALAVAEKKELLSIYLVFLLLSSVWGEKKHFLFEGSFP